EEYEQLNEKEYRTSTWLPFAEALESAGEFLFKEAKANEVTQKEVDAERKALQDAYKKLEKRGDTTALNDLYNDYLSVVASDEDKYTRSTWNNFVNEMEVVAEDFLEDDEKIADATQKEIED